MVTVLFLKIGAYVIAETVGLAETVFEQCLHRGVEFNMANNTVQFGDSSKKFNIETETCICYNVN